MPLKFIVCMAAFMVASSLPASDQVSIPDQNMKKDGETVVHSGLESYVHHPRLVRNSDTNRKSGGAGGVNYGLRVGENTVVKDGIVSTSLELPSINAMDNDIIINQNRNRIFGNSKLVVNQIDNDIFGNSEIEVNQQDNTIGGKSPILMNVDGNNIVGNSSVDVNQQRNQIGLYNKESVPALTTTTVATTSKLPVPALATTTVATTTKLPVPALTTTTVATTTKLPVPALTTTTVATTTKLPATTPVLSTINVAPTTKLPAVCPEGLFSVPGSVNQCFKFLSRGVHFDVAKSSCEAEGLELAKPLDPLALRIFIIKTYGESGKDSWVGARGVGTHMEWIRDGTTLSNNSPLWRNGYPSGNLNNRCVNFMAFQGALDQQPTQLYEPDPCRYENFPLCESTTPVLSTINVAPTTKLPDCSAAGFISYTPSNQCFKLIDYGVSWDEAKRTCYHQGLVLARPNKPVELRSYLVTTHGLEDWVWIDARGDGSQMVWQRDGTKIDNNSPLWVNGQPREWVTTDHCIELLTNTEYLNKDASSPYYTIPCSRHRFGLCEFSTPELGTTTIATTTKLPDCPDGMFSIGTGECFKFFPKSSTWMAAYSMCADKGFYLAEPSDIAKLRKYMVDRYGHTTSAAWLGAKGDGTQWLWQHRQTELRGDDPDWWPGYSQITDRCLLMTVSKSEWDAEPEYHYFSKPCNGNKEFLCQMY